MGVISPRIIVLSSSHRQVTLTFIFNVLFEFYRNYVLILSTMGHGHFLCVYLTTLSVAKIV
jgi:hypothetical protein